MRSDFSLKITGSAKASCHSYLKNIEKYYILDKLSYKKSHLCTDDCLKI